LSARCNTRLPIHLVVLPALLLFAGCAHHCGYVDVHVRLTRATDQDRLVAGGGRGALRVLEPITADQPVLRVQAVRTKEAEVAYRREVIGREERVPYTAWTPVVKPLSWILVWWAWWEPFRDPHCHNGKTWGPADYFRDVLAWYNLFEALPGGTRRLGEEKTLSRSVVHAGRRDLSAPAPGKEVAVYIDTDGVNAGLPAARLCTDSNGEVGVDVRPHLSPEIASRGVTVRLVCDDLGEGRVTARVAIPRETALKIATSSRHVAWSVGGR